MKKHNKISTIIILSLVFGLFLPIPNSQAKFSTYSETTTLAPQTIVTQSGKTSGKVASLGVRDQADAVDSSSKYVRFKTPNKIYSGYRTYKLFQNSLRGALTSLTVLANYKGPNASTQVWTWDLFDWDTNTWIKVGDNTNAIANTWTWLTLGTDLTDPGRFVSPATLEVHLRLTSSDASEDAKLDYEAIAFTYDFTPTTSYLRGLAYSPYRDCQEPGGDIPTMADIAQDLQTIAGMANGIRTYSSTGINAGIPALAHSMGLKVSAGAWLGTDMVANEQEISGLIAIAETVDLDSVIVGNEVMLRGDLTEAELIGYIQYVKQELAARNINVPVTTAEIGDVLLKHPAIMNAVDIEMVHLYPFWNGDSIEGAAQQVVTTYHEIQNLSGGKRVVIGETGWPSNGPANLLAVPSPANQYRFAREFVTLAVQEDVEFFYFDIFDEMWKTQEHGVGQYWGLYYANRTPKYDFPSVMIPYTAQALTYPDIPPSPQPEDSSFYVYFDNFAYYDVPGTSSSSQQYLPVNHFAPSGWMGDHQKISLNTCVRTGDWPGTAIQVQYTPSASDPEGWSGIYWLNPDGNWGTVPPSPDPDSPTGFDLMKYHQLVFRAKADVPGTQIKFFVGGVAQDDLGNPLPYPSSITDPILAQEADPADGFVNLTTDWKEYHIDLTQADLSYVIDGCGWAAERARTPGDKTFYLDDIRYIEDYPDVAPLPPVHIYSGEMFRPGLDMGVITSGGLTTWVTDMKGYMQASYPAGQKWGAAFITVGPPVPPGNRPFMDLGNYRYLTVEMRGALGGETVSIGIKDRNQPDTGSEAKKSVKLTNTWKTYTFYLPGFRKADRTHIYVPIEFVFSGSSAKTIYFRNVQYLP